MDFDRKPILETKEWKVCLGLISRKYRIYHKSCAGHVEDPEKCHIFPAVRFGIDHRPLPQDGWHCFYCGEDIPNKALTLAGLMNL